MKVNAVYFGDKLAVKLNKELIIVLSLVLTAVITGSTIIFSTDTGSVIKNLLLMHISACSDASIVQIFMSIIIEHLFFLLVCFISGSSIFGKLPICILCFYKIAGISSIIATLIRIYLLKGLEYCLLIFLPGKALLVFAIIYTLAFCIKTSDCIKSSTNTEVFRIQLYTKQILFSGVILILSALTDSLMIKLFLPLFDFS